MTCAGLADGTATASPTGGSGIYNILWFDGSNLNSPGSPLSAGYWTVTITDDNLCTTSPATLIFEIEMPSPISLSSSFVDASCDGYSNGSANVIASGGDPYLLSGTAPYTYLWDDPLAQTTDTAVGLAVGTYMCTVIDSNLCQNTITVSISEPPVLTANLSVINVSCFSLCDATASVNAFGGTAPYSYLWSDPASQTVATAIGLCAGSYICNVTDAIGCTYTISVTISEPPVLTANSNVTDASCYGSCDGTASVYASAGSLPYSYLWANGQTSQTEVNLCAGTYFVFVSDNNGCQITSSISISEPPVLTANFTLTDVSCYSYCDGAASVFASGGSPTYNYLWGNGGTTNIQTNLCAGTYPCTVIDTNGCTISTSISIAEPTEILPNITLTDVTCVGLADASATVNPTGGSGIYNVQWFNGSTSNFISNLSVGTYTVIITDNTGCSSSVQFFTIVAPDPLYVNAFSTDISCFGYCDGSAFSTPSGGVAPYNINWSNGVNSLNISGLCAGAYIANITDANNCVNIETVVISEPLTLVSNININGCDSVLIGTNYYTTSGAYTDTLTSVNGCDSVVNTNLTIEQYLYSYDTLSVNSSIVWNGMSLNASGDYSVNLVNSLGCDSIANLNLTVTITGILDIYNNKSNLVKITDMLGQETPYRRNTPLFYIYDDGTVERRIVIE